MIGVPDRLQEPVGEAEVEQVLDRLLAQVVIDAEDLVLAKDGVERRVEPPGTGQVPAERLLDDDSGAIGAVGLAQQAHHLAKERRRDREVVERVLRRAELRAQPAEGIGVVIRPVDEAQLLLQPMADRRVLDPVRFQALRGPIPKCGHVTVPSNTDDRHGPAAVADETRKRGEDLLVRQVPGRAKEDECIRAWGSRAAAPAGRDHRLEPPPSFWVSAPARRRRLRHDLGAGIVMLQTARSESSEAGPLLLKVRPGSGAIAEHPGDAPTAVGVRRLDLRVGASLFLLPWELAHAPEEQAHTASDQEQEYAQSDGRTPHVWRPETFHLVFLFSTSLTLGPRRATRSAVTPSGTCDWRSHRRPPPRRPARPAEGLGEPLPAMHLAVPGRLVG